MTVARKDAAVVVGDEVLEEHALETGAGIEPDPPFSVEYLAGVHQPAGEVGVQEGGQALSVVCVDDLGEAGEEGGASIPQCGVGGRQPASHVSEETRRPRGRA